MEKKSRNIIIDYVTERIRAYQYNIMYVYIYIYINIIMLNILYYRIQYYCVHARETFEDRSSSSSSCFQ